MHTLGKRKIENWFISQLKQLEKNQGLDVSVGAGETLQVATEINKTEKGAEERISIPPKTFLKKII